MQQLSVKMPSWGYGDAGTRFEVFHRSGSMRALWVKLVDAAEVNKDMGVCPSVAIHLPWDKPKQREGIIKGARHGSPDRREPL